MNEQDVIKLLETKLVGRDIDLREFLDDEGVGIPIESVVELLLIMGASRCLLCDRWCISDIPVCLACWSDIAEPNLHVEMVDEEVGTFKIIETIPPLPRWTDGGIYLSSGAQGVGTEPGILSTAVHPGGGIHEEDN